MSIERKKIIVEPNEYLRDKYNLSKIEIEELRKGIENLKEKFEESRGLLIKKAEELSFAENKYRTHKEAHTHLFKSQKTIIDDLVKENGELRIMLAKQKEELFKSAKEMLKYEISQERLCKQVTALKEDLKPPHFDKNLSDPFIILEEKKRGEEKDSEEKIRTLKIQKYNLQVENRGLKYQISDHQDREKGYIKTILSLQGEICNCEAQYKHSEEMKKGSDVMNRRLEKTLRKSIKEVKRLKKLNFKLRGGE